MDDKEIKEIPKKSKLPHRECCCCALDKFAMRLPYGLPSQRTRYSTCCGLFNTLLLFILFLGCAAYASREIYLIFTDDDYPLDNVS